MRQWLSGMALVMAGAAIGADLTVGLQQAGPAGPGNARGSVRLLETAHGLVFDPALKGLAPGLHGFHVHENGSCAPAMRDGVPIAALAAGGHFDPQRIGKHGEPWGDGQLGDLPALVVTNRAIVATCPTTTAASASAPASGQVRLSRAGSIPPLPTRVRSSKAAPIAIVSKKAASRQRDGGSMLSGGPSRAAR